MSFKQHLCQEPEELPASLHKGSTFVTPLSAAKKSLFLLVPLEKGEAARSPSELLEFQQRSGAPGPHPRISCQGYKCSGEKGDSGKLAQVCSVNCKVTVDIIRGVSCSLRSSRRRPHLRAVITEAEEKRSSNKEPNYFYQLVKYIPTC